jgi:hypothetical protein
MTGLHKDIPVAMLSQFADLNSVCVAEANIDRPIAWQVEMIAIQVGAWFNEWMTRTEFLTSTVVPLGVKFILVNMTIKDGQRICRYEAVLRS